MSPRLPSVLAGAALLLAGCGDSSPLDDPIGSGRVSALVGPGGTELRGSGGTPLEGLVVRVPAGALDRLVEVVLEPGPDLPTDGTRPAAPAVRVLVSPDPGALRKPVEIVQPVDLPQPRSDQDLVVAQRVAPPPPVGMDPEVREGIAAAGGSHDRGSGRFTFFTQRLGSFQVRLSDRERLVADADELFASGYEALARLSSGGVREADLLLQQALRADPFHPGAHLLRAISRVLVVLDDRTDAGPGLDSIGEALQRSGLDVSSRSLVRRMATAEWPSPWQVPPGAPSAAEMAALLRSRLRPALEQGLHDLELVPYDTALRVVLPDLFAGLPGERELDTTDLLALRAAFAFGLTVLGRFEDLDLETDLPALTAPGGTSASIAELLDRFPSFGRPRAAAGERTVRAFVEGMDALRAALESLAAEDDPQGNDLVVLAKSFDEDRLDRWRTNLRNLRESLVLGGTRTLLLDGGRGTLQVDGPQLFGPTPLDLRSLTPELFRWVPLAGTLPSPTLGGVLPGMTQERATELLELAGQHTPPRLAISVTGAPGEWTPAARALDPGDRRGDEDSDLAGLDLVDVYLARDAEYLFVRLTVADGDVVHRPGQATVYRVVLETVGAHPGGDRVVADVALEDRGPVLRVQRNGTPVAAGGPVAAAGADLELAIPWTVAFGPTGAGDRLVTVESRGLDLATGTEAGDDTRGILVRP